MWKSLFKRSKAAYPVKIRPLDTEIEVPKDTPILEAALQRGIAFPHSCRVGTCGTCKCRLIEGKVYEITDKAHALTAEEMRENYILACQSLARSDLVIEVPNLSLTKIVHKIRNVGGTITALNSLTHDILELVVKTDFPVMYTAGQYCEIYVEGVVTDDARQQRSYSFAAAPGEKPTDIVRFHIRKVPGGMFTTWLFEQAKVGQRLEGHGPYGDFGLRPASNPILCIAGGSGMAPIKAVLEQAIAEGVGRDVYYLFGVRAQRDLYGLEDMAEIGKAWRGRFEFVPVLSEEPEGSNWQGRRGFVTQHIAPVIGDRLRDCHVYMCGPPPMIDAAEKVIAEAGIDRQHVHFDKFYDRSHLVPGH